jgi:hypothetical protein
LYKEKIWQHSRNGFLRLFQTLDDLEARTKLAGIDISTRQSFLRDPKAAVANLKRQGSI